jgi:hypothetical protein
LIHLFVACFELFFFAYLPARVIFHSATTSPKLSEAVIYLVVGWAMLGTFSLFVSILGLPPEVSVIAPFAISVFGMSKLRSQVFSIIFQNQKPTIALVIGIFGISVPLLSSVRMGFGDYPAIFFGMDTPYLLTQVHALTQFDEFPPPSLGLFDNNSAGFVYHYGAQSMAAILSRLSGLHPHQALFLFLVPVLLIGMVCLYLNLIRAIYKPIKVPILLGILIVVFLVSIPSGLFFELFNNWRHGLSFFANPETYFYTYFEYIPNLFGWFAMILVLFFALSPNDRSLEKLVIATMGLLVIFKAPAFVGIGSGLGLWAMWQFFTKKNVRPLVISLAALVLSLVVYGTLMMPFGANEATQTGGLIIEPGFLFNRIHRTHLFKYVPLVVPLIVVLLIHRKTTSIGASLPILFFWIGPWIFGNIFVWEAIDTDGMRRIGDLKQMLHFAGPIVFPVFFASILGGAWRVFDQRQRWLVFILVGLMASPNLVHKGYHLWKVGTKSIWTHQYVDNRGIAPALMAISPVGEALSVTNSYTYPTKDEREDNQYQLPAIFGHRWFGVVFNPTERQHPEANMRYKIQKVFRERKWNPEALLYAKKHGWSHLLIDKEAPYPENIPGGPIFENKRYLVYRFSDLGI